jgi:hypothetical protein
MNAAFSVNSKARVQLSSNDERSLSGEIKMKTLTTTILLSVMFLSAGAFAGGNSKHVVIAQPQADKVENVTVILKNQSWPLAGQISVDPCNVNRCIDI